MDTIFMIELVIIKTNNVFFQSFLEWRGSLGCFQLFSFKSLFKIAFISLKKPKRRSLSVFYHGHYFSKLFKLSFFHLFWKIELQGIFWLETQPEKGIKNHSNFLFCFFAFFCFFSSPKAKWWRKKKRIQYKKCVVFGKHLKNFENHCKVVLENFMGEHISAIFLNNLMVSASNNLNSLWFSFFFPKNALKKLFTTP